MHFNVRAGQQSRCAFHQRAGVGDVHDRELSPRPQPGGAQRFVRSGCASCRGSPFGAHQNPSAHSFFDIT
jgi:hypothetical protein